MAKKKGVTSSVLLSLHNYSCWDKVVGTKLLGQTIGPVVLCILCVLHGKFERTKLKLVL